MYGADIRMADAFVITIFSMLLVFTALIIISYFIDLVAKLANRKKPVVEAPAAASSQAVGEAGDDPELIAVLAAAVASSGGKSLDSFYIRSVHAITPVGSSWSQGALRELMR